VRGASWTWSERNAAVGEGDRSAESRGVLSHDESGEGAAVPRLPAYVCGHGPQSVTTAPRAGNDAAGITDPCIRTE
jgi:hypothetical protein